MLRLAADENFNNDIVRGLLRRIPQLDIVRVQDIGLSNANDPTVLEWAASEGRILLTHDVATITRYAYERVRAGRLCQGFWRSAAASQRAAPSRIFYCWPNTALKANGKAKCAICH